MTAQPLAIVSSGMVTGVGLSAPATCASIRCAIDGFKETRFMDSGGEWIRGCEVPLEQPWRGAAKLSKMLAMALRECAATYPKIKLESVPVLLCIAEAERPGRFQDLTDRLSEQVTEELGIQFHELSNVIARGHVSAAVALLQARKLIHEERIPQVIVAGADSLLVGPTISAYEERDRVLTSQNSDGFIPGEAAAAILVRAPQSGDSPRLICKGIGFGVESANEDAEEPLRADGLVSAIKDALADAGCEMGDLDFRVTDISGSQYKFKEAALAMSRILRKRREEFDIWHPADCVGETGSVIGCIATAVIDTACRKGYSKGLHILSHMGNDDGKRAAMVFRFSEDDV